MTAKIQVSKVNKSFGSNHVLRDVNLQVADGESMVIIGGSGSGKSVLIKCIIGLLVPDKGTVKIDGQNVHKANARAREAINRKVGMLFQGGALFDSLNVWQNVTFGVRQQRRISKDEAIELAQQKLKTVGMRPEVAFLWPAELSGGMQKRVALARAIAHDPEIIFFDEPTTGLDPIMADVINELIVQSVKSLGATAISITHDMASVRKIAHRVAMIYEGRIIWTGSIDQLDQSGNDYVEQFIHGHAHGPIQLAA